jgi:hypothetical protein
LTRVTWRVPLVEQELLKRPEHMNSSPVFIGVHVPQSLVVFCGVRCPFFFLFRFNPIFNFYYSNIYFIVFLYYCLYIWWNNTKKEYLVTYMYWLFHDEHLEDTKWVIRSCKSQDKQYNFYSRLISYSYIITIVLWRRAWLYLTTTVVIIEVLSSIMTYRRVFNKSNMTGATSGAGTA